MSGIRIEADPPLQQWLKSARTCPVCRGRVGGSEARNGLRPSGPGAAGPNAGPSARPPAVRRRRGLTRRPPSTEDRHESGNDSDTDNPTFPLPPWRYG